MENQSPERKVEFISKESRNSMSFSQNGIRIPENLSKNIIKGKISNLITRNVLIKEDDGYLFKFDQDFDIKTNYRLNKRTYIIRFVDTSGIFNFPLLIFKNLKYSEYIEILQILEEFNVTDVGIKEIEDLAHSQNHTMIMYRYLYLAVFSVFAYIGGLGLYDYISGNERIIIEIYNIINIGCLAFSILMCFLVGVGAISKDSKKLRRQLIIQYVEGIFLVIVITTVFTFALTR